MLAKTLIVAAFAVLLIYTTPGHGQNNDGTDTSGDGNGTDTGSSSGDGTDTGSSSGDGTDTGSSSGDGTDTSTAAPPTYDKRIILVSVSKFLGNGPMQEVTNYGARVSSSVLQYATSSNEDGRAIFSKVASEATDDVTIWINANSNRLQMQGYTYLNGSLVRNMIVLSSFQTEYNTLNLYSSTAFTNTINNYLAQFQNTYRSSELGMRTYLTSYFGRTLATADIERVYSNKKLGYYPLMSNAYDSIMKRLAAYCQTATVLDRTLSAQRLVGFKNELIFGKMYTKDNVVFVDSNVAASVLYALKGLVATRDLLVNEMVQFPTLILDFSFFQNGAYNDARVDIKLLKHPDSSSFESLGTLNTILNVF